MTRLPSGRPEVQPTKPLGNQRDLALAYSPVLQRHAQPFGTIPKRVIHAEGEDERVMRAARVVIGSAFPA
jgi:hypothetical protein